MIRAAVPSVLVTLALVACSDDAPAGDVMFPADYAATYTEVRDCRRSGDHDLRFIRVLVDPAALQPYQGRTEAFPDESIVLKEEFAFDDPNCSGEPVEWTVMRKQSRAVNRLGWDWQRVDADRAIVEENQPSCFGCHEPCTGTGGEIGYDHTCTEP